MNTRRDRVKPGNPIEPINVNDTLQKYINKNIDHTHRKIHHKMKG